MAAHESRAQFETFLGRRLRTARLRLLLHGALAVLAVGGAATLLAAWVLGSVQNPALIVKLGLTTCVLAMIVTAFVVLLLRPWLRLGSRAALCRRLELEGDFANHFVAAEEACRRRDRWDQARNVSPELVRRLFARVTELARGVSLGRLMPLPWAGRTLLGAAAVGLLLAGWAVDWPQQLEAGLGRLVQPWRANAISPLVGLYLGEAPTSLVAGETAILTAHDFGAVRAPVRCEVRSGSGLWQPVPCRLDSLAVGRPYRRWVTELASVEESFSFRFLREGLQTASQEVSVWHPPLLTALTGRVIPPAYTGLEPRLLTRIPISLEVLTGSRLIWEAEVNHPVRWAAAVTTAGDTIGFDCLANRIRGEVAVTESFEYSLHLRDQRGLANNSRLKYQVAAAQDVEPLVQLERPDDDGILTVAGLIGLNIHAADDFGLQEISLQCRREQGLRFASEPDSADASWASVIIWKARGEPVLGASAGSHLDTGFGQLNLAFARRDSSRSKLQVQATLEVHAGGLELVPGDVLALRLEARDNREPGPAGRGLSRVIRLTLPSAAEILMTQAEEGGNRLDDLSEIRRRSQALEEDLDRLGRELKKNPLPEWARQQEMEGAITRQQALQEELAKMADQLQQDLNALAESNLTSSELLDKMDQIAELLDRVRNRELDDLLAQLREAVSKLSEHEISQAINEVARNQQEMLRRLDRAMEMLKEMAHEQQLEGIASLLAQMIRQQQELREASQESAATDEDEISEPDATESAAQSEPEQAAGAKEADEQSGESAEESAQTDPDESADPSDQQGSEASAQQQDADKDAEMAARQQALAQELERLSEQLEKALSRLEQEQAAGDSSPSSESLQKALREALQQMAEQNPSEAMKRAAQQLQEGQRSQAAEQQQEALKDLASLYHVILRSQQGMQMAMQHFQVASLRRLASDLLDLSAKEEQIVDLIPSDLRNVRSGDLPRRQFRVLKASRSIRDRLQALSTASPMESIRLLKKLDGLVDRLDRAVQGLEEGQAPQARSHAQQSLAEMNRIVIGLLTQAQTIGGGGGSCSMPSLGQRLRQIAREQAGLNGLADQLRQQMQSRGLSQEVRSQMSRLQAEQGGLAGQVREISELQSGLQDGERLLGDMERLARDMEQVAQDLDQGLLNEETLIRQERILSRLLDAHNAARKQDYSMRRESQDADRLFKAQEGQDGVGEEQNAAKPFQLRYQPVEKAPLEYRELVRRYFTGLQKWLPPVSGAAPEQVRP